MPTPDRKRRWLHLSPDRFVLSLLLLIGLLWLSERFQWSGFNHHKGWTVLIAVAAVGVAAVVMLLWWIAGLIFRWRFQFGIRSLLAFCLASSIVAGWLAVEIRQARRQAEAVEGIKSLGAAFYDWQESADGYQELSNPEPPGPERLRNMLGDNFFSTVTVYYGGTTTTDAGLEYLKQLVQLRVLGLEYTTITDAGLEHLKGLTQLEVLCLNGTDITDAGLEHLKGLTQLRVLNLDGTKITDAGLEYVTGLSQLRELYVGGNNITDTGLEHVKGLTQLQVLDLSGNNITDAELEHLKGLAQLEQLDLSGTNVTDVGLQHLKDLTQFRVLDLNDTKITDVGVKRLQRALPNCEIIHAN